MMHRKRSKKFYNLTNRNKQESTIVYITQLFGLDIITLHSSQPVEMNPNQRDGDVKERRGARISEAESTIRPIH